MTQEMTMQKLGLGLLLLALHTPGAMAQDSETDTRDTANCPHGNAWGCAMDLYVNAWPFD
jgi:hypothetical protein